MAICDSIKQDTTRFSKLMQLTASLRQIAESNKDVVPLQQYVKSVSKHNADYDRLLHVAVEPVRSARKLGWDAQKKLGIAMLRERNEPTPGWDPKFMMMMPTELDKSKEWEAYIANVAKRHQLKVTGGENEISVWVGLQRLYMDYYQKMRYAIIHNTSAKEVKDVTIKLDEMMRSPYFPATRFGEYALTIYDADGNVQYFSSHGTEAERLRKLESEDVAKVMQRTGTQPVLTMLDTQTRMTAQLPLSILRGIVETTHILSKEQHAALQSIINARSAGYMRGHLGEYSGTEGASVDVVRNSAEYATAIASWVANLRNNKTMDNARALLHNELKSRERNPGRETPEDLSKFSRLVSYVDQHHAEVMGGKRGGFLANVRSMIAWNELALSLPTALANSTQPFTTTLPLLGAKYGFKNAATALVKAYTQRIRLHKLTDPSKMTHDETLQQLVLETGAAEGWINPDDAYEVARLAQTSIHDWSPAVRKIRGVQSAVDKFTAFMDFSMKMQKASEMINREATALAATDLIMKKYAQDLGRPLRPEDFAGELVETKLMSAVRDIVLATQFDMSRVNRPEVLRDTYLGGVPATMLLFKGYMMNLYWLFRNAPGMENPAMATKMRAYMLGIQFAAAGVAGMWGMENLEALMNYLMRMFGSSSNVRNELRKMLPDAIEDIVLTGVVTPALGATVGKLFNLESVPDMSGSLSLGNVVNGMNELLGQRSSVGDVVGAVGGPAGKYVKNVLDAFLASSDVSTQQSGMLFGERLISAIAPRFVRNIQTGVDWAHGGVETKAGYVIDQPTLGEAVMKMAGFQPSEYKKRFEARHESMYVVNYWNASRQALLSEYFRAYQQQSPDEMARLLKSVQAYNRELPDSLKQLLGIQYSQLRQSMIGKLRRQSNWNRYGVPFAVGQDYADEIIESTTLGF